jgi:membrane protein DedA with SNARE-associated domain
LTAQLTSWIAHHGVYAVFALMAVDAVLPAGGEVIMLFAGALASGAVSAGSVKLFGSPLSSGLEAYVVLALSGTLGYLAGAIAGWALGLQAGHRLMSRQGRFLHVSPETLGRADRWFERFGMGAVFLGRLTPVVRSFISIPAGLMRAPFVPYVALTFAGSALWCFAFAGLGWALGGSWESFHHGFRYADYLAVIAVAALVGLAVVHRLRARRSRDRPLQS